MDTLQIVQIIHLVVMFYLIFFTKIEDYNKGVLLAISIVFWDFFAVINYSDKIYHEAYSLGKQKYPYINPYAEKEFPDEFIDAFREGYLKGFKEQHVNK